MRVTALWLAVGAILTLFAGLLVAYSHLFDWALPVEEMPAATLGVAMALSGAVFVTLLPLIRASVALPAGLQAKLLMLVLAVGCSIRIALFFTEPALEDDYNRYLWEGALTANGISPYAVSPLEARRASPDTTLGRLAQEGAPVLARVNHPELKTTYPPIAHAAFALAYLASPWNINAWKLIALATDAATMLLLLMLLRAAGRPALWAALYWWNPIVVKELVNSAHMDGLAVALLLAVLLLSTRRHHVWAVILLAAAIGTKLWPILFAPLVLRPLCNGIRPLLASLAFLGATTVLWLLPAWLGGLDPHSGYVAYLQRWATNSALFPLLEASALTSLQWLGLGGSAWAVARGAIALVLGGLALRQAWKPISSTGDLMRRAGFLAASLVLLSPAQFPWYMIWMIPFLAFRPHWGLLAISITTPLYYAAFHYYARGSYDVFLNLVVWIIWLPVWALLAAEAIGKARSKGKSGTIDGAQTAIDPGGSAAPLAFAAHGSQHSAGSATAQGSRWLNLGLVVVSTLSTVLLVELAYRVTVGKPVFRLIDWRAERVLANWIGDRVIVDPVLGWTLRPWNDNKSYTTIDYGIRKNADETTIRTGSILAVGDSFTEGWEVENDHTWPAILEVLTGRPVVNGGVGAYGADQIFLRAEQLLPIVKPKVLIIGILENDIHRSAFTIFGAPKPYFTLERGELRYHPPEPIEQQAREGVLSRAADGVREALAYSAVSDFVLSRLAPNYWYHRGRQVFRKIGMDEPAVTCALVARLKTRLDKEGIRALLFMQHDAYNVLGGDTPSIHAQRVVACAEAAGVQVVDQFKSLRAIVAADPDSIRDYYHKRPANAYGHMTWKGNRHAARLLAEALGKEPP